MKKLIRLFIAVFAVMLIPTFVFAASPWTTETTYGAKVKGKLDFGVRNTLGGWTEIFTEPWEHHKNKECVVKGFGEGLVNAVADTLGGILHLVTFPIPVDIPLPENGVNFE